MVQAELQVLQTHLELFLCLQINIQTDSDVPSLTASRMNSVQSEHACSMPFSCFIWSRTDTHGELALAKYPQLIISPALLGFQLQDFGLKGLFSGSSLVFYLVDLYKRENFKLTDKVKHITSCTPDLHVETPVVSKTVFITVSTENTNGFRNYRTYRLDCAVSY